MNRTAVAANLSLAAYLCFATTVAVADNSLGAYVGAAFGEAHVRSEDNNAFNSTDYGLRFDESHIGWKVFAGARPLRFLGVEFAYTEFGKVSAPPPAIFASFDANSQQNAATVFAVGYLPLPVPYLDLYGKVGVARLHTQSQVTTQPPTCPAGPVNCATYTTSEDQSGTDLAYGLGGQARFGSVAVRAEYERIDAPGGSPDFFSVGLSWTF